MSSIPKKIVIDLADDEDAWDALDEAEGITNSSADKGKGKETDLRPNWLPDGLDPVLEELPKWHHLLFEILLEVEGEIIRQENLKKPALPGMLLLVFFSSFFPPERIISQCHFVGHYSCHDLVNSHLQYFDRISSTMDTDALPGSRGRQMMMKKLRLYLWWKGKLSERKQDGKTTFAGSSKDNFGKYGDVGEFSKALQKKDTEKAEKAKSRRRVSRGTYWIIIIKSSG